ncbi:MAG: DNA repair protein RadA [Actinomycetota bacterium]|nr:DNA repair protein RadA [Actinomycetota bacterium]
MARVRTVWRCQQCGASAPKWLGRCPDCTEYGTYVEELEAAPVVSSSSTLRQVPVPLSDTASIEHARTIVGIDEFDRVLGGGLVRGSLVLIGGEPGIGKSTLLLQAAGSLSEAGRTVLYVCGEESPEQIGMRARRLGIEGKGISMLSEVDVAHVEATVRELRPDLLVIDSIQTVYDPDLAGAAGSVGQVRAATSRLMRLAKDAGITTMIVGHVTKDGAIAGPRVLEHMVDAVLYFEGDRDHAFRVVRSVKNRFGSSSEIGIFEMSESGLRGVSNPSELLLGERGVPASGSAVMAAMEGSRPLLLEVQALVTPSYLQVPRRLATGIDASRLLQVIGVLERRADVSFAGFDVYVSVAGGVRVSEPAVDVPLALALVSARKDIPLSAEIVAFGEIGLTGKVRPVAHAEGRLREAARQGLTRAVAVLPSSVGVVKGIAQVQVTDVSGLVAMVSARS